MTRKRRFSGRGQGNSHSAAEIGSGIDKTLDQDVGVAAFVVNPKPAVVKHLGTVDDGFTSEMMFRLSRTSANVRRRTPFPAQRRPWKR